MVVPWLCDEHGTELDQQQREIAAADDAHRLINAGPGSGKTRALVAHYLHLLMTRTDWDVENVVAITFTEKAAAEMRERIGKVLQQVIQVAQELQQREWRQRARELLDRLPEAPIGTIHSFCARLLRRFALEADLDPSFRVLDELKAESLRRQVSERWLWQQITDTKAPHRDDAQTVVAHFGFERAAHILSELLKRRLLIEHRKADGEPLLCRVGSLTDAEQALERCYQHFADAYDAAKAQRNALDFDDLLLRTWRLLLDDKAVLGQVRKTHFRILVDELQDTDRVQVEIVRLLCGWDEPDTRVLFFGVGDSQQSIYAFRNADVSVFNKLWRDAKDKLGWRTERLSKNYRSVQPLVGLTNHTFERIFVVGEKADEQERLFRTPFQRMESVRDEEAGSTPTECAFFRFPDSASKWQRLRWEADWIAQRIKSLHEKEGKSFRDIALLLRELVNVSAYEDALRRFGIPYHIIAGYGFFETMEARDLLSFLLFLAEPDDPVALAAWLRSPMVGVSDEALFGLFVGAGISLPEKTSDFSTVPLPQPEQAKLRRAQELLAEARAKVDRISVRELLEWLINETRYDAVVAALPHGRQRLANVRKFIRMAQEISEGLRLNVRGLVRYVKELVEGEVRIGEPPLAGAVTDAVQIMTIHAAKGLEFPIVIVPMLGEVNAPQSSGEDLVADSDKGIAVRLRDEAGEGLERNQMPRFQAVDERRKMRERAESERLLFVAWTRAKDRLILVGSSSEKSLQPNRDGSWSNWLQLIADTLQVPVGEERDEPFSIANGISVWLKGKTVSEEQLKRQLERPPLDETMGSRWLQVPETIPDLPKLSLDLPMATPKVVRLSVTELLPKGMVEVVAVGLASVPTEGLTPTEMGLIVHRLLRHSVIDPDEAQMRWVAQAIGVDADAAVARLDEIRRFVRTASKARAWREAMGAQRRRHELDFRVRLYGEPTVELIGRWDLVCQAESGWLVVDFKTDALTSPDEAERKFIGHYEWQAKAYAYAVHEVFGAEAVRTAFVFVGLPEPVEVTRSFTGEHWKTLEAELAERVRTVTASVTP